MFVPYAVMDEELIITHSLISNVDNTVIVHFEKPDSIYCFKELDCMIPGYNVSNVVGFTEEEQGELIQFCMNNAHLIMMYAREGGVALANAV